MSKQKNVCRWSPHDSNIFVVGAEDLRLYETVYSVGTSESVIPSVSHTVPTQRRRTFRLINVTSEVPQLKCLAWFPRISNPLMLAVGLGSGKVLLTNYQQRQYQQGDTENEDDGDDGASKAYHGNIGTIKLNLSSSNIAGGIVKEFVPKYSRPCNAIAWNPENPNQIAAGLEKVRSDFCTLIWDINQAGGNISHTATTAGTRTATGARPNLHRLDSNMVFRERVTKPVQELANSEATVALSWVPSEPSCLATGTGFKWLRIYDLRGNSSAPLSVVAHSKAVHGVVFDMHRPQILATYSDAPNEPVKVWDIRKFDGSSGPIASLHPTAKLLSQIEWSPTKPGTLATTSLEEPWISLWDVNKAQNGFIQLTKPFKKRYTTEPVYSFSWQHVIPSKGSNGVPSTTAFAAAFPNRLLTSTASGVIEDISLHDSTPLAISSRGLLGFGCGKLLFVSSYDEQSPTDMETQDHVDISTLMFHRAQSGYSMDLLKCIKLFSTAECDINGLSTSAIQRRCQLEQMWQWVHHVEGLHDERIARSRRYVVQNATGVAVDTLELWPVGEDVLSHAGVEMLLRSHRGNGSNTFTISESRNDSSLGCTIYDGPGRRLALLCCNWDPDMGQTRDPRLSDSFSGWTLPATGVEGNSHDLSSIVAKCKREGQWERAAALVFFHGDLRTAVDILQTGAAMVVSPFQSLSQTQPCESEGMFYVAPADLAKAKSAAKHAEILQLVAMAVAGYTAAVTQDSRVVGGQSLWMEMCQKLLQRQEISGKRKGRYLHAICVFLCAILSSSANNNRTQSANRRPLHRWKISETSPASVAYNAILEDSTLVLADRVAFACRFLSGNELERFVTTHAKDGIRHGHLEALVITGVGDCGIRLLQSYLDVTGDVQTVALLTAHLNFNRVKEHPQLNYWIYCYQQLLNIWQLWHERALFDVARSQLEKKMQESLSLFDGFGDDITKGDILERENNKEVPNNPSESPLSVPPQLYVKCNYCGLSLALSQLLRTGCSHGTWLTRAKPKLTCCPSCRKPLPLCALCLLPLGSLNPYLEQANRQARIQEESNKGLFLNSQQSPDHMSELSNIPFVEWFTWCQTCKHGGHSHHLSWWFKSHDVCPVTDCFCKCKTLDFPPDNKSQYADQRTSIL